MTYGLGEENCLFFPDGTAITTKSVYPRYRAVSI